MHRETKKNHVTCFIAIFVSLQWSGTEPQVCLYKGLDSVSATGRAGRVEGQGSSRYSECCPEAHLGPQWSGQLDPLLLISA